MAARWMVLGLLAGLGCFALGLVAARFLGAAPAPPPVEPRIVLDPGTIQLLPDASLHLDLPRGFDVGHDGGSLPQTPGNDEGSRPGAAP